MSCEIISSVSDAGWPSWEAAVLIKPLLKVALIEFLMSKSKDRHKIQAKIDFFLCIFFISLFQLSFHVTYLLYILVTKINNRLVYLV